MTASAGPSTTSTEVPAHLHGVSLARYAGVIAGLSEGLPLPEILRNEGVDAGAWPDAEDAWDERLSDDEGGAIQARFDALLAAAQDRYGRAVTPLADDVGVWLDFVRHMASAEEPLAFTATLGLTPADVLRLHRRWAPLIAGDPEVAAAASAALGRAPHELPRLTVGERRIEPPPEEATAPSTSDPAPRDAADDDEDAPDDGGDRAEPGAPAEAPLFAPLPGAEAEEASPAAGAAPAPAATKSAPPASPAITPPALAPSAPPALAPSAPPAFVPPAHAPAPPGRTTGDLPQDLIRRIAAAELPFAHAAGAARPVPPADEPVTLDPQPSPLARAALPFASSAPAPRATAPRPADSALPFRASAPAGAAQAPPPPAPSQPASQPIASPEPAVEQTLGPAPSPLRAVLPFKQAEPQPAPQARPASAQAPPATAQPRPQAAAQPARLPTLTLDQYASMCAELAVFHDRQEAVFAKYGLADPRQRAAFDAAWKERLRRFPSEKSEWDRRYWQYEASWRRTRR